MSGIDNNWIVKQVKYLLCYVAVFVVAMVITFYKSNLFAIITLTLKLSYLFLIPGFTIGLILKGRSRLEQTIIGVCIAFAFTGVVTYLLGLIEIDVKSLPVLLPLVMIALSFWWLQRNAKTKAKEETQLKEKEKEEKESEQQAPTNEASQE